MPPAAARSRPGGRRAHYSEGGSRGGQDAQPAQDGQAPDPPLRATSAEAPPEPAPQPAQVPPLAERTALITA